MAIYLRLASILIAALMAAPNLNSQEVSYEKLQNEISIEWNRLQDYIGTAQNAVASSHLNFTEEQLKDFQELLKLHAALKSELSTAMQSRDAEKRVSGLVAVQNKMTSMVENLDSEILLPHQVTYLKAKEFDKYLTWSDGDYAKVLKNVYGEDLKLTSAQQEAVSDAQDRMRKEAEAAREEFAKKLKAIEGEYRKKLSSTLTSEQKALIEKHSGKPIIPEG